MRRLLSLSLLLLCHLAWAPVREDIQDSRSPNATFRLEATEDLGNRGTVAPAARTEIRQPLRQTEKSRHLALEIDAILEEIVGDVARARWT